MTEPVYAPPKPIHVARNGINVSARQGLAVSGFALIVLSIPISLLTPAFPVGLMMAILGSVMLHQNAIWGRLWLRTQILRHSPLRRMTPDWVMRRL